MYVYCSTVHNSKDLEPTPMPVNDRLDKENVAHICHGILYIHKKGWVHVLCRDVNEAGNCHPQQTDTRTGNQTPHVLTRKWVLNSESSWTQGGEHHTPGPVGRWGGWGRIAGGGSWGEITWGEMPDRGDGEEGNKPHCHVCTCATILHVLHMYPKT